MEDWWQPRLETELSQGDVVVETAFHATKFPFQFLRYETGKGGREQWVPSPTPVERNTLFPFRGDLTNLPCIVLSHSCELDKRDSSRVAIAPMQKLSSLTTELQDLCMQQKALAWMPLPGTPTLGDMFGDLRCISYVSRDQVKTLTRVASMTDAARMRLQAQIVGFFTRLMPNQQDLANQQRVA